MMNLRATLKLAHSILEKHKIDHALIGGLALACYGSTRATIDLDLLIHEDNKENTKNLLLTNGFNLVHESSEVLQFSGIGYVDIILARRPISQNILLEANPGGPEEIKFVKADIQFLMENVLSLDFGKIKLYADLFSQWSVINEIKNKIKL